MSYPNDRTTSGAPPALVLNDPRWWKILGRKLVDPSEDNQAFTPIGFDGQRLFEQRTGRDPNAFQDPSQPIALQSGVRAPEKLEGDDAPIVSPRPVENRSQGQTPPQVDELTLAGLPMHRPRYANPQQPEPVLPILPKTASNISARDDVRGGDTIGKAMPVDPNELPQIPSRNFSQYVLAPDQTKNPDYTPETIATRPKVVDELGYAETHTPMPRHGRIVEGLKGAGLGFLRGVGATGTLGGGIGGAATLGTMSAIDPKYAESAQNQMFTIPHLQQQEATRIGRQTAATKQAEAQAGLRKTQAETADIIDRPVRERIKTAADIAKDNRTRTEVERHNKAMETLTGTSRADSQKRFEETQRHNRAMEDIGRGRNEVTGYGQDVVAENENSKIGRENQVDEQTATYKANLNHYNRAKVEADAFNKAHDKLDRDSREYGALEDLYRQAEANPELKKKITPQQTARYGELQGSVEADREALKAKGETLFKDYGDVLHYNSRERIEYGEPPTEPTPVSRQPVRSRRMPAQTSAGRISRQNFGRFREQNPQFKDKSDAEIESVLKGQGYEIY